MPSLRARWLPLLAGPALGLGLYLLLAPAALAFPARALSGVLLCALAWWVTEALPLAVSALLATCLCVVLGVGEAKPVLAPYADPVIFLFLGSFWIARAMSLHGLDRRIALRFLSVPAFHRSPRRLLAALTAVAAFVSMWVSNTAACAMLLPIVLGMLDALPEEGRPKGLDSRALLLLSFGVSLGGMGTPIGTPPNLVGLALLERHAGVHVGFLNWMGMNLPIVLACVAFAAAWTSRGLKGTEGWGRLSEYLAREKRSLGGPKEGEWSTLLAFSAAVALWLFAPLPEGVSAVLAASLLFVLPAGERPALTWEEAAEVDWGTLLLFGGGMSLGGLLFETGLAETLGTALLSGLGLRGPDAVAALAAALALFVSEIASNTASANVSVPVALALARTAGVEPLRPALSATLGSSLGFLLPVSTPPNAMVYGTGRVPLREMMRFGLLLDLFGLCVVWAGMRWLALP